MSGQPAVRRLALSVLALALIALLAVLAGNLHRIDFLPGKPLISAEDGAPLPAGGEGASAPGGGTIFRVLAVLLAVSAAALLIGSVFSPTYRRILLACLVILAVFWLLDRLVARDQELEAPLQELAAGTLGEALPRPEIIIPPAELSTSARLLVAFVLAGAAVAAAAYAWRRFGIGRFLRRSAPDDLQEIAGRAAAAADRIRAGGDPSEAVLRCYAEMLSIAVRVERVNPTHLTPREVAASLRRLGMASEHAARLTEMFELVRYGARSGRPFAAAALDALDAVRAAYSVQVSS